MSDRDVNSVKRLKKEKQDKLRQRRIICEEVLSSVCKQSQDAFNLTHKVYLILEEEGKIYVPVIGLKDLIYDRIKFLIKGGQLSDEYNVLTLTDKGFYMLERHLLVSWLDIQKTGNKKAFDVLWSYLNDNKLNTSNLATLCEIYDSRYIMTTIKRISQFLTMDKQGCYTIDEMFKKLFNSIQ